MDSGFSIRSVYRSGFIALLIFLVIFLRDYADTRTTLVFCDVGQGDGAYIRIKNSIDVVIDAGPERKILDCLGKYMPFYDRTIELAFISHPQKDHSGGFLYILERYKVETLLMSPIDNTTASFKKLQTLIKEKNIQVKPFYRNQQISTQNAYFRSVWPTNSYIEKMTKSDIDLNNFSQVFLLELGETDILFTGDIGLEIEETLLQNPLPVVSILKVPHHGSKNGLTEQFLKGIRPQVAVISVGKNNRYGHPSTQVLDMLEQYKVSIRRTDKEGDIVYKIN